MPTASAQLHTVKVIRQILSQAVEANQLTARVLFNLQIDGKAVGENMYVDVHQPSGTALTTGPVEVGPPMTADGQLYRGHWNHNAFSRAVEYYYRNRIQSIFGTTAPSGEMFMAEVEITGVVMKGSFQIP